MGKETNKANTDHITGEEHIVVLLVLLGSIWLSAVRLYDSI